MSGLGNKEIFSRNLRNLMQKYGKDRNQICDELGFKYSTFSDWYNGNKYPRIDKIEMLANYFGILKSDLIEDKEVVFLPSNVLPLPKTHKVPLLGSIACGAPILAEENMIGQVDLADGVHADFALQCKGDSMINARIFDGDLVYIRIQPEVENGEIAAIRIGDEATLKRVYYTPGSNRITLRACNPLYPDQEYSNARLDEIKVLGKAVAFFSSIL